MTARILTLICAISLLPGLSLAAQHGTAEGGYYPLAYHGDVFTGTVTGANDETREVALSFTDPKSGKIRQGNMLLVKK